MVTRWPVVLFWVVGAVVSICTVVGLLSVLTAAVIIIGGMLAAGSMSQNMQAAKPQHRRLRSGMACNTGRQAVLTAALRSWLPPPRTYTLHSALQAQTVQSLCQGQHAALSRLLERLQFLSVYTALLYFCWLTLPHTCRRLHEFRSLCCP